MTSLKVCQTAPSTWTGSGFAGAASVPTSVTATPGNTTILLQWSPPASNGGSAITGYRVGRDGTDSTGYGPWSTVVDASIREITFASLNNAVEYNVYVEAITALADPGARATLPATPTGTPPAGPTVARTLGVFHNNFPAQGNASFTTFQDQLLGGGVVKLSASFSNASFPKIISGNGTYPNWKTWLDQGSRLGVLAVGLVPKYGPNGTWPTKAGTDAEVSAALAAGASGTYDSNWVSFAQTLVANGLGDMILRLAWEFNGGWYSFRAGANPSAFVTYWRRVADIIRTHAPNVRIDWNASGSTGNNFLRNGSGQNVGALDLAYPGDAYVDIIGVDMYDQHGSKTKVNAWDQVTGPALEWWKQFAADHGKPLSIPEWGTWGSDRNTVDADNDHYINKMWAFIEANDVAYHIYFDVGALDGDHQLTTPTDFPNAAAAFAAKTWRLPVS